MIILLPDNRTSGRLGVVVVVVVVDIVVAVLFVIKDANHPTRIKNLNYD